MQRVLCLWIRDWPLQRLAIDRPELHGRAVVLYEASPQGGLKVVATSGGLGASDQAAGPITSIYPGMPLTEAVALIASAQKTGSTEPHLEPADPQADRLALEQLAEWCHCFSPIAGLEDALRPDCLLLDVTGLASLFGGERALAEKVVHAFADRGLNMCVVLADTIGAAWAAVHAKTLDVVDDIAPQVPNSVLVQILPPGETLSALAPLPIGYLRVAEETITLLATLGITRIGQLAALPRSALLARFGPEMLRRFDQAIGSAPETILARHAPPEYMADFTFEAPLTNREAIEHVLGQLIAQVTEPLARRREGVLRLVCRLKYERAFEELTLPFRAGLPVDLPDLNSSFSFTLGLFRPSASSEYLCDLLRLRLENVRMAGPVVSVHVEVTSIGPLELRQQAMFDRETDHDQPRRLAGLVDRLSNRLGRAAVVQVALLPDAQPEYTCVDVPLAGGTASAKSPSRSAAKKSTKKNLPHVSRYGLLSFGADERPLALLPQAARIEVVAVAPHGAPGQFRWAGHSYSVAYAWGPERIETGWWRTPTTSGRHDQENRKTFVRRDYYRVETTSGARFWIFRSLVDRQWFLQGRFD